MFRSHTDAIRVSLKEPTYLTKCYNCDFCKEGGWSTEADVDIHKKKKHKLKLLKLIRSGKDICIICLRKQKSKAALIDHIKTRHLLTPPDSRRVEREIFFCDHCKHIFFNKKLLIAHIKHAHVWSKEDRKFGRVECPKCDKLVAGKTLWCHFLYHNILSVSTCPICADFFENTELLMEHIKSHPGYYFCNICGYDTTKEQYFKNHVETHKNNIELPSRYIHEDVNRFFLPGHTYGALKIKISNPFKGTPLSNMLEICVLCREICMTGEEMRRHIVVDHGPERETKPKAHMCVCGEMFFNAVLLRHHLFKLGKSHRVLEDHEVPGNSEHMMLLSN